MFDAVAYDMTPADAPAYSIEWRQAAATPLPNVSRGYVSATEFFVFRNHSPHVSNSTVTATSLTNESHPLWDSSKAENTVEFDVSIPVAKAAADRSMLLARKYGMGVNREEASRLDILTERLRKLAPRVSVEETDSLALMVSSMEELSAGLSNIRERYTSP